MEYGVFHGAKTSAWTANYFGNIQAALPRIRQRLSGRQMDDGIKVFCGTQGWFNFSGVTEVKLINGTSGTNFGDPL